VVDLNKKGFKVITINGDLSQKQRDYSMNRFKNGSEDILVATDIAARGIDVPTVGNIINYDIPEDPLIYFHRIGRTARAGGSGKAISLVSSSRYEDFSRILKRTELPIKRLNDEIGIEVPTLYVSRNRVNRQRSFEYNSQNRRRFGGINRGINRGRYHYGRQYNNSQYKRG